MTILSQYRSDRPNAGGRPGNGSQQSVSVVVSDLGPGLPFGGPLDELLGEFVDFTGLDAPQVRVEAAHLQQVPVGAALDYSAVLEDEYPVGVLDG